MDQNQKLNQNKNERYKKMLAFVKSQTDCDEKQLKKLEKWNNNYMHVIKDIFLTSIPRRQRQLKKKRLIKEYFQK